MRQRGWPAILVDAPGSCQKWQWKGGRFCSEVPRQWPCKPNHENWQSNRYWEVAVLHILCYYQHTLSTSITWYDYWLVYFGPFGNCSPGLAGSLLLIDCRFFCQLPVPHPSVQFLFWGAWPSWNPTRFLSFICLKKKYLIS